MARLPQGVAPTPHKIRLRGYREDLVKRGGRRLNTDIEAEANQALTRIMIAYNMNVKDAVTKALVMLAQRLTP